jgi:hypothetical protein
MPQCLLFPEPDVAICWFKGAFHAQNRGQPAFSLSGRYRRFEVVPRLAQPRHRSTWPRPVQRMTFLRRLILVVLVFAVPLVVAQTIYELTIMLLEHYDRIVNPMLLRYISIGEYTLVFILCLLEADERW